MGLALGAFAAGLGASFLGSFLGFFSSLGAASSSLKRSISSLAFFLGAGVAAGAGAFLSAQLLRVVGVKVLRKRYQ
jgi:hypothetical protein